MVCVCRSHTSCAVQAQSTRLERVAYGGPAADTVALCLANNRLATYRVADATLQSQHVCHGHGSPVCALSLASHQPLLVSAGAAFLHLNDQYPSALRAPAERTLNIAAQRRPTQRALRLVVAVNLAPLCTLAPTQHTCRCKRLRHRLEHGVRRRAAPLPAQRCTRCLDCLCSLVRVAGVRDQMHKLGHARRREVPVATGAHRSRPRGAVAQ